MLRIAKFSIPFGARAKSHRHTIRKNYEVLNEESTANKILYIQVAHCRFSLCTFNGNFENAKCHYHSLTVTSTDHHLFVKQDHVKTDLTKRDSTLCVI